MSAASRGRGRVPDWPQYLSWDNARSRGVRGDTGKLPRMRPDAKRHRVAEGFNELLSRIVLLSAVPFRRMHWPV